MEPQESKGSRPPRDEHPLLSGFSRIVVALMWGVLLAVVVAVLLLAARFYR